MVGWRLGPRLIILELFVEVIAGVLEACRVTDSEACLLDSAVVTAAQIIAWMARRSGRLIRRQDWEVDLIVVAIASSIADL